MTVHRFFEKDVIVRRLKTVAGNRKAISTTATVDGALQEMDRTARTELDMVQDRAWVLYVDIGEDIKKQDRVVIDGINYDVLEVTKKDYMNSSNMHLEIILIHHAEGGT